MLWPRCNSYFRARHPTEFGPDLCCGFVKVLRGTAGGNGENSHLGLVLVPSNTRSFGSALKMTMENATGRGISAKTNHEIPGPGPGPRNGFRGGGVIRFYSLRTHIHCADTARVV